MGELLGSLLQLMLTALGAVPLPPDGMLGVAAALVALAILTMVAAIAVPHSDIRSTPHPRRAIDTSILPAQSDPDAAGHPRPRAPGVALSA